MSIKRLILILLTIFAIAKVILSLGESVSQPQIQSRLELYQTNLILHAAEFQPDKLDLAKVESSSDFTTARKALLGNDPYLSAQKQYQKARKVTQANVSNLQAKLQQLSPGIKPNSDTDTLNNQIIPIAQAEDVSQQQQQLQKVIDEEKKFIYELDLKLGILAAQRGETETALKRWNDLIEKFEQEERITNISRTAETLKSLWSNTSNLSQDVESQIKQNLDGWFRYRVLIQLTELQEHQNELSNLQAKEQNSAYQAMFKLALIAGIPALWGILGIGLIIFLLAQLLFKKEQSILAINNSIRWETPWDGEIVWQVIIVGFFCIGQILLPLFFGLSFGLLRLSPTEFSLRLKALYVLSSYIILAFCGIFVLYISVKKFFPLPKDWFNFQWFSNWSLWGLGGYLVALPLVLLVSLINQQIWQGQGGSNPLLFLALQAQDTVALAIFFFTASVAAPIFEEIIFRGFLLPSLTRYIPVWGSIIVSSLIFAIAHLSVSEVLPLTTLGIILAFVYTRSRNLLSSILLHSLWNSGTLLSLFILGSGVS
ncbi:MAG: CPBP family intramembrane metalloprotease [Moorea sp. SIO2B7]|nr:CPBP family intramembrane metalloprotease [Moorena sp. SIO2B7]